MVEKSITRADLALELHRQIGISINESEKIIGQFFESIMDGLNETGVVKLTNFGTFYHREKKERMGRNPKTKEPAVIAARKVVNFKPSDKLRDLIK